MTKKTILILLYLLLSILLPACGAMPPVSDHYERLHIKAEQTGDWTKVTRYLEDEEKAKVWAQYKADCTRSGRILRCKINGTRIRARDPVLIYRKERNMCKCEYQVFQR